MTELVWGHSRLSLRFEHGTNTPFRLSRISDRGEVDREIPVGLPVVEVLTAEDGRTPSSNRLVRTAVGERMRYLHHEANEDGGVTHLRVWLADAESGLHAKLVLTSWEGIAGFRSSVRISDGSGVGGQVLLAVPSWSSGLGFALPDSGSSDPRHSSTQLTRGSSDWLAEGRWERVGVREQLLPDLNLGLHGQNARGNYSEVSTGTWSTGANLPLATIESRDAGISWAWQVEHNGPWRWELGEDIDSLSLSLSGPTDIDHQWSRVLAPGDTFTTVSAAVAIGADFDASVAELTLLRRASRLRHPDNESMSVVFNDYMNTLMGDPTTEKLLPLVDAAAEAGAEVFCIDAGWYADDGDWWDGVGEWLPSSVRFPSGLEEVTDRIRSQGMVVGLWLEPEVLGVKSRLADSLPAEAFFTRDGRRIVEHGRYHLDFTSAAVRDHLDGVIDRLVSQFGVGYFKLDYNIDPGAGTESQGQSVGDALLSHNRAYLAWLDAVLLRHPNLILENCSSGAMRMDFALLSRLQIQSTSDQQDFVKYPPIAASAPLAMLPEQAASWAYPQPTMTAEEIAFCLCTSMLGRFFVSGYLNRMSPAQRELVAEAIEANKAVRGRIRQSVPHWPLGLPVWDSPWVAVALQNREDRGSHLVTVWKRSTDPSEATLDLHCLRGCEIDITAVFPTRMTPWNFSWDAALGTLTVRADAGETVSARTIEIRPRRDAVGAEIAEFSDGHPVPSQ